MSHFGFGGFKAVTKKNYFFWDVTPCGSPNISEECIHYINRVARFGELETLAKTSN
jgi:hypothetical protein